MTPKSGSESSLLSPTQVGSMLGLSSRSVLRYANDGRIPAPIRVSKRAFRWPREVIEQWIANAT